MPNNCLRREYHALGQAPRSSQPHYPKNTYRELRQLQFRHILLETFLTKRQILHPNGWLAHPRATYRAERAAIYRERHDVFHHQKGSLHRHPTEAAAVHQRLYRGSDRGCGHPKIR